ncbi:MAG: hypothetical protein U0Q16_31525 [Bryobacteraceae bacterium]
MPVVETRTAPVRELTGDVSCYICTRIVKAAVVVSGKRPRVRPGQKCQRCGSAIDSAAVLRVDAAPHPIATAVLN